MFAGADRAKTKTQQSPKMNIFFHGIGPVQVTQIIWSHITRHLNSCGLDFTLINGNSLLSENSDITVTEKFVPIWRALRDAQGHTLICTDGCLQNPLHIEWMYDQGLLGSNALVFSTTHDHGDEEYTSRKHDIREAIKATGVRHIALRKTPLVDDAAAEAIMRFQSFYVTLIREGRKRRKFLCGDNRPFRLDEHPRGRHLLLTGFH